MRRETRRAAGIALAAALWCATGPAPGSDLISAEALTDRVILLHFDDGKVEYHGYHQADGDDRTVSDPLSVEAAGRASSYVVRSIADPAFELGVQPESVGRKSKGMDWSRKCLWNGTRCDNDVVFEHWIYLMLPGPMTRGAKYAVEMPGIGSNRPAAAFAFDEYAERSEAVHVNHLGYLPDAAGKYAYVSQWMGDAGPLDLDAYAGKPFHVIRIPRGDTAFSGEMKLRKDLETGGPDTGHAGDGPHDNFIGADLMECDFSALREPGAYVLVVEGAGRSYPFMIHPDAYRRAFFTACRGLYHERAGIELARPHTKWPRPRDHHPDDGVKIMYSSWRAMDSADLEGKDTSDKVKESATGAMHTWGWYHDAGDWDGYPSHLVVPRHLLTVYELKPGNFADGELQIPESGNGIPDIVDEASWLVSYLKRTRGPTGGVAGGRVHAIGPRPDGKPEHGFPSWEDTRTWYVYGEEPKLTFQYASLAAQLGHCLGMAGRKDAGGWRKEAEGAYRWAERNMREGDEGKIGAARLLASAWLYKTTGGKRYHERFKAECAGLEIVPDASNPKDEQWAVWAYLTAGRKTDRDLRARLRAMALRWADDLNVTPAERRGFRAGWHWNVPTVIGFNTTPHVIESIIAYELTKERKYLDVIQTTCDYMLGGNGLNMCWVSGLGHRYPKLFLHLDSWYDAEEEQIPGVVPYAVSAPQKPVDKWVGPWDTNMVWDKGVHPSWEKWPLHEGYVENRYCVMGNEFTVHQNIAPAAAVYGYLCAGREAR